MKQKCRLQYLIHLTTVLCCTICMTLLSITSCYIASSRTTLQQINSHRITPHQISSHHITWNPLYHSASVHVSPIFITVHHTLTTHLQDLTLYHISHYITLYHISHHVASCHSRHFTSRHKITWYSIGLVEHHITSNPIRVRHFKHQFTSLYASYLIISHHSSAKEYIPMHDKIFYQSSLKLTHCMAEYNTAQQRI